MSWIGRLRSLFEKQKLEDQLDEELQFHIEMRTREFVSAGMTAEEARYRAQRLFGNQLLLKERTRDMDTVRWIETLWQDLRYGLRSLRKSPGFTTVAVLSLALGIGANTAIFSVVDAVLLKMLPVKQPERLVELGPFVPSINARGERYNFSYPLFKEVRDRSLSFSGVFAALDGTRTMDLIQPGPGRQTEKAEVQLVSGEYFQVLGVNAIAGRILTPEDNKIAGANAVAVISYGFWKRRFARDYSVIGRRSTLNDLPFTIVGVTPPEFFGESVGRAPDIWIPLTMQPALDRGMSYLEGNVAWLRVMARLHPGSTEQQARAELAVLLKDLQLQQSDLGKTARELARFDVVPGNNGLSDLRKEFSQPLRLLMAVVGLVLLIACANVANLLLARATARQKEIAIRLAIGAGRLRLIRQLLTESALLAVVGGTVGLVFAAWGSRMLLLLLSGGTTAMPIDVSLNGRVLAFTIVVSAATGVLFGLAPALQATRQNLNPSLSVSTLSRSRVTLSRTLIVAQVALCLLLVTGAGLFIQTLRNLRDLDLGFSAEHILQVRIDPASSGYRREQLPGLYTRLLERLNSAPGVTSVSMSGTGFASGTSATCCIAVEGYTPGPSENRQIGTNSVTPRYFETISLPLLLGRNFAPEDASRYQREPHVAIVNEAMARYYFGNANPVGRRFGWGDDPQKVKYGIQIIGVAKDANYGKLRERTPRFIYFPATGGNVLQIRTAAHPVTMEATIRREIQAVDKTLRADSVDAITELVDRELVREKLVAKLSSFFGALALLLAAVGLYGLMAYAVLRRTQEIGIRVALGATRSDLVWMVLRETLTLVSVGVAIAVPAALSLAPIVSSMLFGIMPSDPVMISVAVLVLSFVATLAGYLPARRASMVDPLSALRCE
ncbi:MAG: hypothetical protein DMG57_00085 [Acidobacteria bacterium]|nr:MAG: hypothetical protein DMG57_00085 [Acidobacteriota bacterium]